MKLEANKLLQHHLNSLFDQPFKRFQGVKYRNIFKYSVPFKERFCTLQKCASLLNVSVMILITAKGEFQSTGIKLSENLIHFSSSLKITQFIGVPDFTSQVCFMTSCSILYSNTTRMHMGQNTVRIHRSSSLNQVKQTHVLGDRQRRRVLGVPWPLSKVVMGPTWAFCSPEAVGVIICQGARVGVCVRLKVHMQLFASILVSCFGASPLNRMKCIDPTYL